MNAQPPERDLDLALRASEQRYRSLFARNPVPMCIIDPESLAILAVNDAAVARYGYPRDELLRMGLRDLCPPQELGALWRARIAMRAGEEIHGVFRHRTASGEVFDAEVRTTALADNGHGLMIAMIVDVSEYRRAADVAGYLDHASSLLTSTLDRRTICRSLATLAAIRFGDWCAVHWVSGEGRVDLCGFAHGNPLDETIVEPMVRGRDVRRPPHPVATVVRTGRMLVLEPGDHGAAVRGEAVAPRGSVPWQVGARAAMYVPIRDGDRVMAVIECVAATDDRAASALDADLAVELASRAGSALRNALRFELARREAVHHRTGGSTLLTGLDGPEAQRDGLLLQVIEHITDGFLMLDAEWTCTYLNQVAERIFSRPREEIVGRSFWSTFPNLEGTTFEREYTQAMRTRQPTEFEAYYGEHGAWYRVSVQPTPHGLGIFFRDTTETHRAEEERRAGERLFFEYAELASELIHIVRADGRVLYANRAWQETLGYDLATLRTLDVVDILDPETREVGLDILARAAAGEIVRDVELTVVAADGRRIQVGGSACGWALPGQVPVVFGSMRRLDASDERSRVAAALRATEAERRTRTELVERMNFELRTPLTAILGLSDLLERTGADRLEALDLDFVRRIGRQSRQLLRTVEDILTYAELDVRRPGPADLVSLPTLLVRAVAEVRARAPEREVELAIDDPGTIPPVAGDAERILQLVRYLLEHAAVAAMGQPVVVTIADDASGGPVLRLHHAGHAVRAGLGLTIARSLASALGFELWQAIDEDEGSTLAVRFSPASTRPAEHGARADASADPDLSALLHAVVNASPLAVVVYDTDHVVRLWSDAAARIFGWTAAEVVGSRLPIVPDDELPRLRELLRAAVDEGVVTEAAVRRRRKDGRLVEAHSSIAPLRGGDGRLVGFVALVADVTETSQLESQLRQAQKMEVVGQLAGGIAHDFNNLLTVISANAWFLLEGLPGDTPHRRDAEEIQAAAERAAALTRQLLVFARRTLPERRIVDLRETVHATERMLRRLIGSNIELAAITGDEPCLVDADPAQLEQVVMNLAINARDAMPRGGAIAIEVQPVERVGDDGGEAKRWVQLAISDTGAGMTPEVAARVFEPFFTTKEAGHGTGLGLAIVHTIVSDAGGELTVESAPGAGTTIRILLPAVAGTVEAWRPGGATVPPRGSGTVLVAEDQDALRRVVARALRAAGYSVLTARHGADALAVAAAHAGAIDVLVTDVVMPVMDGIELAARLREARPATRIVIMSGYSERLPPIATDAVYIHKPFTTAELAAAVQQVLAAAT